MSVSGKYNGEVVRTSTDIRIGSSGEIKMEPGAELYGLTRNLHWDLSRGIVSSASGGRSVIASGNPSWVVVNGVTDPSARVRWTSAAGTTQAVHLPPMPIPDDLATDSPLVLRFRGEGSSANATNELDIMAFVNIGDANAGTTMALTSAVAERTVTIASGDLATAGFISLVLRPKAHASGFIDLYSLTGTYKARSRAT